MNELKSRHARKRNYVRRTGDTAPMKSHAVKRSSQTVSMLIVVFLAALLIFGGGAYLFSKLLSGSIRTFDESNTMQLEGKSYLSDLTADGTIVALDAVNVICEVEGTVSKVKVAEGDKVFAGETLFLMKNDDLVEQKASALSSYKRCKTAQKLAKAQYEKAAALLKKAKARRAQALKRAQEEQQGEETDDDEDSDTSELTEDETATTLSAAYSAGIARSLEAGLSGRASLCAVKAQTTSKTVDMSAYDAVVKSAKESFNSAQSDYEDAQENTQAAKLDYENSKAQVQKLTVRAPQAGTVVNSHVEEGLSSEAIMVDDVAMRIVDYDSLVAVVQVPEQSIALVERGQDAAVVFESVFDESGNSVTQDATVSKIASSPTSDEAASNDDVSYYAVRLTLNANESQTLKEGMAISASIKVDEYSIAYYVPASAIYNNGSADFVEVVYDDATTKQHEVSVLGQTDDGLQVIQGNALSDGVIIRTDLTND